MRLEVQKTIKAGFGPENTYDRGTIFDSKEEKIPKEVIAEFESGSGTIVDLDDPTSVIKHKPIKTEAELLREKLLKEQKKALKVKKKKKLKGEEKPKKKKTIKGEEKPKKKKKLKKK